MAVIAGSFGGRAASRYRSARHALTLLVLVVTCVAFAAEKDSEESCFLALHFADGNTASIQLSNLVSKAKSVDIERYYAVETTVSTKRPSRITFKGAGRSNPGAALRSRRDQSTANWQRCAGCCVSPTNGRRFSAFPGFGCFGASTPANRS